MATHTFCFGGLIEHFGVPLMESSIPITFLSPVLFPQVSRGCKVEIIGSILSFGHFWEKNYSCLCHVAKQLHHKNFRLLALKKKYTNLVVKTGNLLGYFQSIFDLTEQKILVDETQVKKDLLLLIRPYRALPDIRSNPEVWKT